MTNTVLLEKKIKASGLKKGYIAEALGLSRQGFSNKVTNESFFNADEIEKLCELLNIKSLREKESIFFNK